MKRSYDHNKDPSLYGNLHNIYYHALMMRAGSKSESKAERLADQIQSLGYKAVSLIKSHPSELGKLIHDQDLGGYINQIEKLINELDKMFLGKPKNTIPIEIKLLKTNLASAKQMAFGKQPLLNK